MSEMIPGIEYDFGGGRVYTLPPLSMGAMERLQKGLAALSSAEALSPESITTIVDAAHAALRRNYPAMTRDDVAELVDVGNMFDVVGAVLDVSGIKRKAQAEAKNPQAQQTPASTLNVTPALTGQP